MTHDSVSFEELKRSGDSLLEVAPDVTTLRLELLAEPGDSATREMTVEVNEHHRLRSITFEVEADSFESAVRETYNLVMPILSRWAFVHDVAITIAGVEVHELGTDARQWRLTMAGAVKRFSDPSASSTPQDRRLLEAYREGLSSTEPLYQALSYFKVIEGVWSLRMQRRAAAVANGGQPPREPGERVPLDSIEFLHGGEAMYADAHRPYLGKKFTQVREQLRDSLRNSIAHLDFDRDPFGVDTHDDVVAAEQALPILRYMARILLSSEL